MDWIFIFMLLFCFGVAPLLSFSLYRYFRSMAVFYIINSISLIIFLYLMYTSLKNSFQYTIISALFIVMFLILYTGGALSESGGGDYVVVILIPVILFGAFVSIFIGNSVTNTATTNQSPTTTLNTAVKQVNALIQGGRRKR